MEQIVEKLKEYKYSVRQVVVGNTRKTLEGTGSLNLNDAVGGSPINAKIYGKSVQDAIPTSDVPVEIKSVGTYNKNTRKYEVEVKTTGKNTFPIDSLKTETKEGITRTINDDGSITFKGTSTGNPTFYISANTKIFPNNYVLSIGAIHNFPATIRLQSAQGGSSYYQIEKGSSCEKFTYNNNEFYNNKYRFMVWFSSSNAPVGTVVDFTIYPQLEIGKIETDYEKYKTTTTLIELDEPLMSKKDATVKDCVYLQNGKLYLKKQIGEVVLNGSENWRRLDFSVGGGNLFRLTEDFGQLNTYKKANILCSHFQPKNTWNEKVEGIILDQNLIITTESSLEGTQTLEDFKTWLSQNNVKVQFLLAEPETIELGELPEPIEMFEGNNNISIDADFSMSYYSKELKDITNYKYSVKEV